MFGRMVGMCGPMYLQEQLLSWFCVMQKKKSECEAPDIVTGLVELLPPSVSVSVAGPLVA